MALTVLRTPTCILAAVLFWIGRPVSSVIDFVPGLNFIWMSLAPPTASDFRAFDALTVFVARGLMAVTT